MTTVRIIPYLYFERNANGNFPATFNPLTGSETSIGNFICTSSWRSRVIELIRFSLLRKYISIRTNLHDDLSNRSAFLSTSFLQRNVLSSLYWRFSRNFSNSYSCYIKNIIIHCVFYIYTILYMYLYYIIYFIYILYYINIQIRVI